MHLAANVQDALQRWLPRLIANGLDWNELQTVQAAGVRDWTDWFEALVALGRQREELAAVALDAARRRGLARSLTAGEAWARAALYYHFACFALFEDRGRQNEGRRLAVAAYRRGAPHLDPPARRIEVSFAGVSIPAIVRLPEGPAPGRRPWVLFLPGLDSAKEEFHTFEQVMLARGIATVTMDGPGQGEVRAGMPWRLDYHRAAGAVIDAALAVAGLGERFGVLGVSFGGYLAAQLAASDPRVAAVVAVGGCHDLHDWDALPPLIQADFAHFCAAADRDAARPVAASVTLADLAPRIGCPLLVIHGDRDGIFPDWHARRLAAAAPRAELWLLPGGNHVCNNMPHRYRPQAADWLAAQLVAASA